MSSSSIFLPTMSLRDRPIGVVETFSFLLCTVFCSTLKYNFAISDYIYIFASTKLSNTFVGHHCLT